MAECVVPTLYSLQMDLGSPKNMEIFKMPHPLWSGDRGELSQRREVGVRHYTRFNQVKFSLLFFDNPIDETCKKWYNTISVFSSEVLI